MSVIKKSKKNHSNCTDQKIRRRADILSEEMDDETVLFDPKSRSIYTLNQMAAVIWELCDGEHTPAEISAEILGVFNVDPKQVQNDVLKAIDDLLDKRLIETN